MNCSAASSAAVNSSVPTRARRPSSGGSAAAQYLGAAATERVQRRDIPALVEMRPVEADLGRQRVARLLVGDRDVEALRELGAQPRDGRLEPNERPECVE